MEVRIDNEGLELQFHHFYGFVGGGARRSYGSPLMIVSFDPKLVLSISVSPTPELTQLTVIPFLKHQVKRLLIGFFIK